MFEKTVLLSNFTSVKKFVEIAASKDYDIELVSKDLTVDAKNIENLFKLDLTKPLVMVAHCDSAAELSRQIAPYFYKD